ncbi:Hsp20/alpha crystallin family protein [uncultured Desulfobacter sp.]|uniref:Hsp20/alpha crystallin family protein n=1 Tax=uncultured Desulfobacter sp. TaxID=240139 RepID=UPI002AA65E46|nr:Hsp20/alpha crystallin family protein [uncultured Desulfobacter sp.]
MDRVQEIKKQDEKNVEKTRQLYKATPSVDIYENEDEILLHADMPGVVKENISVDIDNGTLSISGVRKLETKGAATYDVFSAPSIDKTHTILNNIKSTC